MSVLGDDEILRLWCAGELLVSDCPGCVSPPVELNESAAVDWRDDL